jgi:hypothetical protein
MKHELKYPIKIAAIGDRPEYELKEINLVERLTVEHAEHIPDECFIKAGTNPVKYRELIASMAGIDVSVVNQFDFVDMVGIQAKIITPFLIEAGLMERK